MGMDGHTVLMSATRSPLPRSTDTLTVDESIGVHKDTKLNYANIRQLTPSPVAVTRMCLTTHQRNESPSSENISVLLGDTPSARKRLRDEEGPSEQYPVPFLPCSDIPSGPLSSCPSLRGDLLSSSVDIPSPTGEQLELQKSTRELDRD